MIKLIKHFEIFIILIVALGIFAAPYAGYHPGGVVSGSMEPEIPVGSLVYAQEVEMSEIAQGDIVVYNTEEQTIVHRVIENNGETLITKGDANEVKDPEPVTYEQIVGEVVLCIPYAGSALQFVVDNKIIVLVFVIAFNFLLFCIDKFFTALKSNEND